MVGGRIGGKIFCGSPRLREGRSVGGRSGGRKILVGGRFGRTGGQKDGCYQVHYLPRVAVDNEENHSNRPAGIAPVCKDMSPRSHIIIIFGDNDNDNDNDNDLFDQIYTCEVFYFLGPNG